MNLKRLKTLLLTWVENMPLAPSDYSTLNHKISVIIERTPIEVYKKKEINQDDTTFVMNFPCGWFKTLEVWYTVVNPKAQKPAYVFTHMFLTNWFHSYELNLNKFDRVFLMGRIMRHHKEFQYKDARKERMKLEPMSLKVTRKAIKLVHRIH